MATKKIYLVDTENVGSTWKDLLPIKMGADQILLFFTENSPYVSYLDLQLILQFPDRFEMIKCNPGKNGLDFQLVSYLGYLLKTASKSNYVIVSNDNGFDAVVKFWQERGMSVSRMNVHHVLRQDIARAKENSAPTKSKQEPLPQKQEHTAQTAQKSTVKRGRKPAQPLSVSSAGNSFNAVEKMQENPVSFDLTDITNISKHPDKVPENPASDFVPDNPKNAVAEINNTAGEMTDGKDQIPERSLTEHINPVENSHIMETLDGKTDSCISENVEITAEPETAKAKAALGIIENVNPLAGTDTTADSGTLEKISPLSDSDQADTSILAGHKKLSNSGKNGQDAPSQDGETGMTAAKPGTKRKSVKTTRTSAPKKSPQAEGEPMEGGATVQVKKRKRASGKALALPVEPVFPDTENIELDFSNLTVSEKAALLRKYLPKEFCENQESFEIVSDIMFGHDTTNHHQLHLAFVKSFGDEIGTQIYKAFRPHLAEFRA
ncbi:MAG: hypothetical protein K2N63_06420 [Lachnospiraceae bacterium]|nr:hypothetical protein [Lachnospiraceae bacterium]